MKAVKYEGPYRVAVADVPGPSFVRPMAQFCGAW